MTLATDYNYHRFSFALEQPQLERWLKAGPHTGELAPDFELEDLDRHPVRLSALRGAPVVLEFGSYTCPIFSDRVPEMDRLALEHPDARFLVIVIREAHPGEITRPHATLAQKRQSARRLAIEEGIRRRVLVDDLDGSVHCAYGGVWNPVYVIDADGRVVFRRAWNHPDEVAQTLDAVANGLQPPTGESIEMAQLPSRGPTGLRLLERGGKQALLDFYHSAPPPLRTRLRGSRSEAVRAIVAQEENRQQPPAMLPAGPAAHGQGESQTGGSESLARRALQLMDEGNLDEWEQTMEPDCEFSAPGLTVRGRTAVREFVAGFRRAFPDVRHTLDSLYAVGQTVILEVTLTATHTGPLQTPNGEIPPTGQALRVREAQVVEMTGGKAAAMRIYFDRMEMMAQLGLDDPTRPATPDG